MDNFRLKNYFLTVLLFLKKNLETKRLSNEYTATAQQGSCLKFPMKLDLTIFKHLTENKNVDNKFDFTFYT